MSISFYNIEMLRERKKIGVFLFALSLLFLFPFAVEAKEYCMVVSGSGKNLGDEVACGTEHFYVIENKDGNLRLLAKYNLNVGDKIDYFDVEDNGQTYFNSNFVNENTPICMNYATEKGYSPYFVYPMSKDAESGKLSLAGCRVYEKIEEDSIHQDERAVGTKLVDGKSVLPLYGITYMNPSWGYEAVHDGATYTNVYDANGDLVVAGSSFEGYLNGYKAELERQSISFENLSFVTLDKILSFFKEYSGKEVTVELEYPNGAVQNPEDAYIGKMDVREYTEGIEWIYDITYWLGSGFKYEDNLGSMSEFNDYYISNEGMLCALGRGQCGYLKYPIGNGVRPAITISEDDIRYVITTKTEGEGSIEVVDSAVGGESISFRITVEKGYKLQSIIVTSEDGEKVEFTEGEIIENDDGTVSIDKNKFTMPFKNVTIEAVLGAIDSNVSSNESNDTSNTPAPQANPKTGDNVLAIIALMIINLGVGVHLYKKMNSRNII